MFLTRLKVSGDGRELTCIREQPDRAAILESVKTMRQEAATKDAPGFGRWALSIPFEDWISLREKYPELASPDAKIKSRAYLRFMRSAESLPFRVRERI
jgi:hypothetical protein